MSKTKQKQGSYVGSSPMGQVIQSGADLHTQIKVLEEQLKSIREKIKLQMDLQGLDRVECGDTCISRRVRHNWTYSSGTENEMLNINARQKWEQKQGIAQDNPTSFVVFTTKKSNNS